MMDSEVPLLHLNHQINFSLQSKTCAQNVLESKKAKQNTTTIKKLDVFRLHVNTQAFSQCQNKILKIMDEFFLHLSFPQFCSYAANKDFVCTFTCYHRSFLVFWYCIILSPPVKHPKIKIIQNVFFHIANKQNIGSAWSRPIWVCWSRLWHLSHLLFWFRQNKVGMKAPLIQGITTCEGQINLVLLQI